MRALLLALLATTLFAASPATANEGAAAEAARQVAFARAELRAQNFDKALRSAQSALVLDPQSLDAVLIKALALEQLKDLDLARSLLEVHAEMSRQAGLAVPEEAQIALLRVTGQRKELRDRRKAARLAAKQTQGMRRAGGDLVADPVSFALLEPVSRTATTYEVRRTDDGWSIVSTAWYGTTEHLAGPDLAPRSSVFTPNPSFEVAAPDGGRAPLPTSRVTWDGRNVEALHPGMASPWRLRGRDVWDSGTWPVRVGARLATGVDRFTFDTLNYTAVGYLLILANQDFVRTEWEVRRTGTLPCDDGDCIVALMVPTSAELERMGLELVFTPEGSLVRLSQGRFEAAGR